VRRRRFLSIVAAAGLAGPVRAAPDWSGRGFGADLALTLSGAGDRAGVLAALPRLIARIEAEFSLHDPASALSRLNAGAMLEPSPTFAALIQAADRLHRLTGGAFDPSVQALWTGSGGPVGWERMPRTDGALRLPPGMALTFNGIAQGFAAEAARALLAAHGYREALIDLGEMAALGGPWQVGIADPAHGLVATRRLTGGAIATSSARATLLRGGPHILHPAREVQWSTVSVEAGEATLADGLSTAMVLMSRAEIEALLPLVRRVVLVDARGDAVALQA
jgi:thiamine biosynthesis lipoprotein